MLTIRDICVLIPPIPENYVSIELTTVKHSLFSKYLESILTKEKANKKIKKRVKNIDETDIFCYYNLFFKIGTHLHTIFTKFIKITILLI